MLTLVPWPPPIGRRSWGLRCLLTCLEELRLAEVMLTFLFRTPISYNCRDFAVFLERIMPKRRRATVLAAKDGLFLLVQEQGQSHYSLPGGGIEHNEMSLLAAVREVHEETRLKVSAIRYLGDLDGRRAMHFVFYAEVYGEIRLQRKEIAGYKCGTGMNPFRYRAM